MGNPFPIPLETVTLTTVDGHNMVVLQTAQSKIPYVELMSVSEGFSQDSTEATRVCLMLWGDRFRFIKDMLGTSSYMPGTSAGGVQGNLSRLPPEQHPEYTWMYASEARVMEGIGTPPVNTSDLAKALTSSVNFTTSTTQDPSYSTVLHNLARVSVRYVQRDYDVFSDADTPLALTNYQNQLVSSPGELARFVSKYQTYAAENYQLPGGLFYFADGNTNSPIMQPAPKVFPTLELNYVWRQVPLVPQTAIDNCLGKTNSDPFDGYPSDTLLFMSPDVKRIRTAAGDPAWDIGYKLIYRSTEWNKIYRKSTKTFVEVSTDGNVNLPEPTGGQSGKHIYDSADLNTLFILS